jgi:hypothetical protein
VLNSRTVPRTEIMNERCTAMFCLLAELGFGNYKFTNADGSTIWWEAIKDMLMPIGIFLNQFTRHLDRQVQHLMRAPRDAVSWVCFTSTFWPHVRSSG